MRPGILFLNFGGPREATELAPFLTNLFDDVLPGPRWFKRFLAPRLATSRAAKVRGNYEMIGWSPVVSSTIAQMDGVKARLGDIPVAAGMLFTPPSVDVAIADLRAQGADALVALALFPQFSLSTTSSAFDRVHAALKSAPMPVRWIPAWHDHPGYIAAVASAVRAAAATLPGEGPIHLLFSPHGLPMSFVRRGDPYPEQVRETARRVVTALDWTDPVALGWQSRVGPVKWLAPSTEQMVDELAKDGAKRLLVVPVSFVGEHIETLHELDIELKAHAQAAGIQHFGRAATVGTDPVFLDGLADVVRSALKQFDQASCVRCLLPKPGYEKHAKCPTCGFARPVFSVAP